MARVRGMDVPPELLSLAWKVLDPSYEPPGPAPPTIHWTPNTAYDLGSVLIEPSAASSPPGLFFKYTCTRAGTSDPTTEPLWPIVGSIIDAGCTWLAREYIPYAPAVARHSRPSHAEPPHVPTTAQLTVRDAFRRVTAAVAHMTPTEKHAWFQRADPTGQEYWNMAFWWFFWGAYYANETESSWLFPRTRLSDPASADQIPLITLSYPDQEHFHLSFYAELDKGTFLDNPGTRYQNCAYYIHDRVDFDPFGYSEAGWTFNPTVNGTVYYTTLSLPRHTGDGTFFRRRIIFKKQIVELDRRCTVWKMEPQHDPDLCGETLHAFWGPTNPWSL